MLKSSVRRWVWVVFVVALLFWIGARQASSDGHIDSALVVIPFVLWIGAGVWLAVTRLRG